ARITVGETIEITDTNSANGLVMGGQRMMRSTLTSADTVTIGSTVVSVVALHRTTSLAPTSPVVEFNRSPRVVARFPERKLKAPKPPTPPEPQRFPYLAMVAPLIMGTILYSVTRTLLSIDFLGRSPTRIVGTYLHPQVQAPR